MLTELHLDHVKTVIARLHDEHVQHTKTVPKTFMKAIFDNLDSPYGNATTDTSHQTKTDITANMNKGNKNLDDNNTDKSDSKVTDQSNGPVYEGLTEKDKTDNILTVIGQLQKVINKGLPASDQSQGSIKGGSVGIDQSAQNTVAITDQANDPRQPTTKPQTITHSGYQSRLTKNETETKSKDKKDHSNNQGIFVNTNQDSQDKITYITNSKQPDDTPIYVQSKRTKVAKFGVLTQIQPQEDSEKHKHENLHKQPNIKHDKKPGLVVLGPHSDDVVVKPIKIANNGAWKGWRQGHTIDIGGLQKIKLQKEHAGNVSPLVVAPYHQGNAHRPAHAHTQGQTATQNTKPKTNASFNGFSAVSQPTSRPNAGGVCWDGDIAYNKTLIGGINAGVFKDNGKATTMDMCMQFCCKRADCDLAFMIEDDCYSVACSTPSSCKTRKARPTQFYPRISYTRKFKGKTILGMF